MNDHSSSDLIWISGNAVDIDIESADFIMQDSSFEEDMKLIKSSHDKIASGSRFKRHGGGSRKGKAPNKFRNRLLGHRILINVSSRHGHHCCEPMVILFAHLLLLIHFISGLFQPNSRS
jgi:hypothetical protein